MSKGYCELFSGVKSSMILGIATKKADALSSVSSFPEALQQNAKRFYKSGSNAYDRFEAIIDEDGNYRLGMRKPGNVPGSYAIYYKIVDQTGRTIRTYKETYGPDGNLIHVKEK